MFGPRLRGASGVRGGGVFSLDVCRNFNLFLAIRFKDQDARRAAREVAAPPPAPGRGPRAPPRPPRAGCVPPIQFPNRCRGGAPLSDKL